MSEREMRMRTLFSRAIEMDRKHNPPLADSELAATAPAVRSTDSPQLPLAPARAPLTPHTTEPPPGSSHAEDEETLPRKQADDPGHVPEEVQHAALLNTTPVVIPARGGGIGQWSMSSEVAGTAVFNATAGIRSFGSHHAGFTIAAEDAGAEVAPGEGEQSHQAPATIANGNSAEATPPGPQQEEPTGATSNAPLHSDSEEESDDDEESEPEVGILQRVAQRQSGVALADDHSWSEEKAMILLHLHNPELFKLHLPKVRCVCV